MEIAAWLKSLGLQQYKSAFRANDIDAEVLSELTAEELVGLGVTSIGHRHKMLAAIAALRDSASARVDTASAADTTGVAPPEGERRQVAVLFADLAGYTRLSSELDAEEVHRLLTRFFELVDGIVEHYGGRIDKHIGDCAMAVFGAPVAYGNDSERAVRAALDVQARMPALRDQLGHAIGVHIGVASGQVVASATGSDRWREYTVTGESVNLASRLTDEAGSGEILLSDAVCRALADRLDCADAGELMPKGFARPIRAWRLLTLHEPIRSDRRPFVGRQGELGQFEAVLASCRGSGCGRTVFVRGQAGIGKTRLIEEFRRVAEEQGFACYVALVLDFGMGTGQDAIRSLVRSLLGLSSARDPSAAEITAARVLLEGLIADDQRVYLNDLLDLPQPIELRGLYDAMDNSARNRGKRETVGQLIRNLSQRRPLFLVVEDIHWADPLTLMHFATLAMSAADCCTVLALTSRSEGDPLDQAWRATIGGAPITTIDLDPLRPMDAKVLADTYLDVLGDKARRCIDRAAGNPLFLEHLLRHAEESVDDGLPGSLQSLIQARVDRLDPLDKAPLQAASVLGQRFSLDALRHLLKDPGYSCVGLLRQYLVRPEGDAFLFAHALIREGVYGSLLNVRKRDLHRSAAEWYAGRDLVLRAKHLDLAENSEAPGAYLQAAQSQMTAYRSGRALRLVERGIVLARERSDVHALTCLQGELLHDLGSINASVEAYRRALDFAEQDAERCRAWIGFAAGMRVTDQYTEAFQALEKAEAAAVAGGLLIEQSRIHHLRGNLFFPLGNIEGCVEQHHLALRYAQQAGSPEAEARALGGLGDAAYVRGRMITAHENFRRCVELCRENGFGRVEVANLNMAALTRQYANELRGAREDALAAVEAATKVGHQRAELLARNISAFALYDLGEMELAKEHLDRALALIERLGARRFVPENLVYMAKILRMENRGPEASELLEQAMAVSRETGITFFGPRVLAEIALNTKDPKVREEALAEGEAILRQGCVGHNHLWFYRDAIDACLNMGHWDMVERYASALEQYTDAEPLPWSTFFVGRGRVLVALGRGACDERTLGELVRFQMEAERVGFRTVLPAMEEARAAGQARQQ